MPESTSDRARYLRRQIESIRDTIKGNVYDVVVKVRAAQQDDREFVATVADALRRRRLSSSARDVLPVSRHVLDSAPGTEGRKSQKRTEAAHALRDADRSLSAHIARADVSSAHRSALRKVSFDALKPFLASDIVRRSSAQVAEAAAGKRKSARAKAPSTPPHFWTSSSAVVRVHDRDLPELVKSANNIEDIFPNRRLYVAPVVVPQSLPQAVEDNKVSSWGVRLIGGLASWGAFGARGKDVVVGLLDTGVDADHPDLKGKIVDWAEFDPVGRPVPGSKAHDSDQHGTHCAGTIVGGDASGRWIGMAPEAKIAAGLVLNGRRGGTDAQILAGMEWAINNQHVDVISMSLGGLVLGPDVPSTYTKAILSALQLGIPVVTAIGNEGSQTSGSPGNDFFAFAVGATDHQNRAAGFSGGRTQIIQESEFFPPNEMPVVYSKPDVSAPGVAVYSSIPNGKWEYFNGTSMATPHVAGAIALLLSATKIKSSVAPNQRAFVIQDLITGSAEELGEAGQNHRFGFGRIDILRAIGFARARGY